MVVMRILAVAVLTLAACMSGAERNDAVCDSHGFTRGTNEYANCMMQLDAQRRQEIGPRSSYWADVQHRVVEDARRSAEEILAAPGDGYDYPGAAKW